MKRTQLREHSFRLVFEAEFYPLQEWKEQVEIYLEHTEEASEEEKEYIRSRVFAVIEQKEEIDAGINLRANRWKTSRMNKTDLAILRLAIYEIRWDEEIPEGVAIDEAVELAKRYSSNEAPAFVNGILAGFAKAE
ncbi:transcription antitermination factor NusB [Suipraeoptans intestinalis]|uniref:Transcription antitermination protein NusB n=1 Tax=Suipraeoptans intestinalis TaxID=2606628 RepID=A0A6N7URB4_9FIRM|nr:transcription antitermination factor NusB [Suipraeoptans intestinalis]MDD7770790.1 transcription antitermination factor NusB [Suipraeoptans intestinalis]MDY3122188.1 transcription antitermination factor NusB [Suipraeoptans intestinalis]MSR92948.1 transcription antitermination factor NusB [Suipraeoptans intestinalis]